MNVNTWEGLKSLLLKECYDLAMRFEELDTARGVIREKSRKIAIPKNYISEQIDVAYSESDMQIISKVIYGLSLEGFSAVENTGVKYEHEINKLPSSAEKEYVMALLALRSGTNETQRVNALRHIRAAYSYSPNDPRYIALASVLQDVEK